MMRACNTTHGVVPKMRRRLLWRRSSLAVVAILVMALLLCHDADYVTAFIAPSQSAHVAAAAHLFRPAIRVSSSSSSSAAPFSVRKANDDLLLCSVRPLHHLLLQATALPSSSSDEENTAAAAAAADTVVLQQQQQRTMTAAAALPQVFSAGYSTKPNFIEALQEAVDVAVAGLPRRAVTDGDTTDTTTADNPIVVDLCVVTVSSLYDNNGGGAGAGAAGTASGGPTMMMLYQQPSVATVPALLAAAQAHGVSIRNVLGCSSAGAVSSRVTAAASASSDNSSSSSSTTTTTTAACRPVELEGVFAVSLTLAVLPDTQLKTFHVASADLPEVMEDDGRRMSAKEWKRAVGLSGVGVDDDCDSDNINNIDTTTTTADDDNNHDDAPLFWLLPSPAFGTDLDALLQGLAQYFPGSQMMGGIASTVSSLSRAKVYRWSQSCSHQDFSFADGCVGVALSGDIQLQSLTAQGAKPVGGIYQILKGQGNTIQIIVLDERATEALKGETDDDDDGYDDEEEDEVVEEEEPVDARAAMAQVYAKAQIPKPVLAEANFLMRTLSDDDQAFMRRQLLVGLEQGGSVGRSASELARLAAGMGHRFTVHQVASAGMKDGSVTLPLGSVDIAVGTRLRFFVREPDFARREIEALWTGYKKRLLTDQFNNSSSNNKSDSSAEPKKPAFTPACCFLIPTLDRGSKFFQGKQGYESITAARMLPGVPCVSGFFANGIVGKMDGTDDAKIGVQGSASGYFLFGSKSGRPVYSAAAAAAEKAAVAEEKAIREAEELEQEAEDVKRTARTKTVVANKDERSPRSDNGELIIKRREVHSGRALTVSTVEWSVAEKAAKPSSALEGFMWDKETEVDRFRERVPLSNLASQCRASLVDPAAPKPRDWIGPIKQAAAASANGSFVIVPECKRSDPASGTLRRRYDLAKLVRDFTVAGAPAVSVNCDSILFGGTLDHITEARKASSQAAVERMTEDGVIVPPILASDLILYPYQLYKLRLAGADAVNLICGALASKDVLYLTKIASSLQLQALVTVTSAVQIERVTEVLPAGSLDGIIVSNRELEDLSFDETGEQVLSLLKSDALKALREKHGDGVLVLAEGRIGMIERMGDQGMMTTTQYLKELKAAGALGAIVGSGLV